MLNCHPQLIAIVTDRASQGWPTIVSRNCGAGMTGIECRAVPQFKRGQCPESLEKGDTVSPFGGHMLAAVELRGSHSPCGIRN